jgi:hypothetical protein
VGEVVGGYVNGEIEDKLGVKSSFYANIVQFVVAFAMLMYVTIVNDFSLWQAFVMNTAWGMTDSGVNIFAECIAGFQFPSVTIPFSIFFFGQSMFVTLGTVTAAILTKPWHFATFYLICGLFCVFAWALFWFTFDMIEENDPEGEIRS